MTALILIIAFYYDNGNSYINQNCKSYYTMKANVQSIIFARKTSNTKNMNTYLTVSVFGLNIFESKSLYTHTLTHEQHENQQ